MKRWEIQFELPSSKVTFLSTQKTLDKAGDTVSFCSSKPGVF
jgi:hypothetical protein